MGHNEALKKFLKEQKKNTPVQKPRYGQREWSLMILQWNSRDWEVLIARDPQIIADYTAFRFSDPSNWVEQVPFGDESDGKMKGIKLRPRTSKLYGGKIRGPQKAAIIRLFNIPKDKQRNLKIVNLDKE